MCVHRWFSIIRSHTVYSTTLLYEQDQQQFTQSHWKHRDTLIEQSVT